MEYTTGLVSGQPFPTFASPSSSDSQTARFAQIPIHVANQLNTVGEFRILIVLLAYGWRDGFAFPSLQTVMREANVCRSVMFLSLKKLAERGLITRSGQGWKIHLDGPEKSVLTDSKVRADGPPSLIREKRKEYMPTTNVRRVSDDDEDRPAKKKPAASPKLQAVNQLVSFYEVTTKKRATSYDRKKIGELYAEFGDELGPIIKAAWSKSGELLNERFPVFTAQTVWVYAHFKYKPETQTNSQDDAKLALKGATKDGILNESTLAGIVAMYGLQERDLFGYVEDASIRQSVCDKASALLASSNRVRKPDLR